MSYCEKCGAKLNEGDNFCTECGAPVPSASSNRHEDEMSDNQSKSKDKPKGKKSLGGILGLVLPIVIAIIGIGVYGIIKGNHGGGDGERYLPNILRDEETSTEDESSEAENFDISSSNAGETLSDIAASGESQADGYETTDFGDLDGIEGIVSLDDMSESELKAYEERLWGNSSPQSMKENYSGTWESVGLAVFKYGDIANLAKEDIAKLIEREMAFSDIVKFVMNEGMMKLWIGGGLRLYGNYTLLENGNISIVTESGESSVLWMYSPDNSTLYSYIHYVEDDGTDMASCIKYKKAK